MASYKIKSTLSCPDEIKVKLKDKVVKLPTLLEVEDNFKS